MDELNDTSPCERITLPTNMGICSNTYFTRLLQRGDNDVDLGYVQPHYYRVWFLYFRHQLGKVAGHSN